MPLLCLRDMARKRMILVVLILHQSISVFFENLSNNHASRNYLPARVLSLVSQDRFTVLLYAD